MLEHIEHTIQHVLVVELIAVEHPERYPKPVQHSTYAILRKLQLNC
jgi:hypothetical protein